MANQQIIELLQFYIIPGLIIFLAILLLVVVLGIMSMGGKKKLRLLSRRGEFEIKDTSGNKGPDDKPQAYYSDRR